jgi:phosphoribosylformylglycinamidine cyclo-ligase
VKIKRFGQGVSYLKENLFPTPPIFSLIQEHGAVPWDEMYSVFNMGHRMELYVPKRYAGRIIAVAESFGIEARVIGHVEAGNNATQVTVRGAHGEFEYLR